MPSSRAARMMRTAISPRLAIRSLWIVMDGLPASNVDLGDRLTSHHGVLILDEEAHDLAGYTCLHLVEGLHDLDEPDRVVQSDRVAVGLVDWLVRCWLAVECAGKGRKDLLNGHGVPRRLIALALVCLALMRSQVGTHGVANGQGDGDGIRGIGVD